jgi:hypothetical protein
MNSKYLYAFIATLLPGLVVAQGTTSYQCNFENLQRRIEILTEPGVTVPCEVHYYKDSEMPGEKRVLWTASTEEGYCEAKTMEFVAQLREWGWECAANSPAEPAPPTADSDEEPAVEPEMPDTPETSAESASDDTAALTPAE